MAYPRMMIDLKKIKNNARIIDRKCRERGITLMGITKSFCGDPRVVETLKEAGIAFVGDSRLENLERIADPDICKALIRLPMISEAQRAVEVADITFNSEYGTICHLNDEAKKIGKIHGIVILVEMGDLREGIAPDELPALVERVLKLSNIRIVGIGANFSCYGGVIPDEEKMAELSDIAEEMEKRFKIQLEFVSGGNSSSLYLLKDGDLFRVNNLRVGEGIVLGRETAFGTKIPNCYEDAFTLEGEIIEIKEKGSVPSGRLGVNAFGERPRIEDLGIRKRAILALGRQDIEYRDIRPRDRRIRVLGASSDHLILDITDSDREYKIGDAIPFTMEYGSLVKAMASIYVDKYYLE